MQDTQIRAANDGPVNQVEAKEQREQEPALRGTFASVMLLGAFIAVSWIGVFVLFIHRN